MAFIAYLPVLGVGFLSDDLILLKLSQIFGIYPAHWLPNEAWPGYRPVGALLTWQIGYQLWWLNPWPYHLIGLLAHAVTALLLGLWLAEVTRRQEMGLLAGILFGVFPLHGEAVAWLAAQWDIFAVGFGLLGLLLFTRWWRLSAERNKAEWPLYLLALLGFFLSIFSKETLLAFLPVFAVSAWYRHPPEGRAAWAKLLLSLAPFAAVVVLNVGLRLVILGDMHSYPSVRRDYGNFFWDQLLVYLTITLAPINTLVFEQTVRQFAGALSTVILVGGLLLFGRQLWRLVLLVAVWIVLALAPILNLSIDPVSLGSNRFLYLAAAGYCALLAALIFSLIEVLRRWRPVAVGAVVVLVALTAAVTWAQLRPWQVASAQAVQVEDDTLKVIPPQKRPKGSIWYVENLPDNYKGAYIYRLGFGIKRGIITGDDPFVESTPNAAQVDVSSDPRDSFALRLDYDASKESYSVGWARGISTAAAPPVADDSTAMQLWDFRGCDPATVAQWQVSNAPISCEQDRGLIIRPASPDAFISNEDAALDVAGSNARLVRLRVAVRYPVASDSSLFVNQWFWHDVGGDWDEEQSASTFIKRDGLEHVYMTVLPAAQFAPTIKALRFDPANTSLSSAISWLAIDLIK